MSLQRLKILTASLLCLALIGSAVAADDPAATAAEIKKVTRQIEALQQKLKQNATQQRAETRALRQAERDISDLARAVRETNTQLTETRATLARLKREAQVIEQRQQEQQSALQQDLRIAYQAGDKATLRLLLSQENPAAAARQSRYLHYFQAARVERLQAFEADLRALATNATEQETRQQTLIQLQAQQQEREQSLQQARAQREQALAKLRSDASSNQSRISSLEADQKALQELLETVQAALKKRQISAQEGAFSTLKGKLPWPNSGKLAHRFGTAREQGKLSWNGVVIHAQRGSEVTAIHFGRVVFADWMRGYGLLLIIDHGNGYLSLYGHNDTLLRRAGDWVNPGDPIGLAGTSGGQAQPSVYFEIRKDGKPLNPSAWCR